MSSTKRDREEEGEKASTKKQAKEDSKVDDDEDDKNKVGDDEQHFFYLWSTEGLKWTKTKPDNLEGTYDILFHYGFCMGETVENRTTRGTVTLTNGGLAGHVQFIPGLSPNTEVCFQKDFTLKKGSDGKGDDGQWECVFNVRIDVDDYDLHCGDDSDDEYWEGPTATLTCVEEKFALPWIKEEVVETDDLDEGEFTVFQNLEEAEKLAQEYETKKNGPCPPVFFLEPGDLVLETEWAGGHGGSVDSTVVLRKRNTAES